MLIGNKTGSENVISTEEGEKFANENGMKFIESNSGENLELALMIVSPKVDCLVLNHKL